VADKHYIPERNDIIWLDFEPTKGKEIATDFKGRRPALVLSSKEYNSKTGLLMCCPISTSIRGGATEVPVNNLDKPSVVAAGLVQTLSWRERQVKKITAAQKGVFKETLLRLLPLMGANEVIEELLQG
jgi:mRNA interferase MazF